MKGNAAPYQDLHAVQTQEGLHLRQLMLMTGLKVNRRAILLKSSPGNDTRDGPCHKQKYTKASAQLLPQMLMLGSVRNTFKDDFRKGQVCHQMHSVTLPEARSHTRLS